MPPSLKLPGSGNSWGCPTSQIGSGPGRNKKAPILTLLRNLSPASLAT